MQSCLSIVYVQAEAIQCDLAEILNINTLYSKKSLLSCQSEKIIWLENNLPPDIQNAESLKCFKNCLKIHLFDLAFNLSLMN